MITHSISTTTVPSIRPKTMPIPPMKAPSLRTVFLICFFVAPTDASIPYWIFFSDTDILKLFPITKALVAIIISTTTAAIK